MKNQEKKQALEETAVGLKKGPIHLESSELLFLSLCMMWQTCLMLRKQTQASSWPYLKRNCGIGEILDVQ